MTKTFRQQQGPIAYADPTEVSGCQAAFADLVDHRARGECALLVAVSDTETVGSRADGCNGEQESCDMAKHVAEAMVKTLQGS